MLSSMTVLFGSRVESFEMNRICRHRLPSGNEFGVGSIHGCAFPGSKTACGSASINKFPCCHTAQPSCVRPPSLLTFSLTLR